MRRPWLPAITPHERHACSSASARPSPPVFGLPHRPRSLGGRVARPADRSGSSRCRCAGNRQRSPWARSSSGSLWNRRLAASDPEDSDPHPSGSALTGVSRPPHRRYEEPVMNPMVYRVLIRSLRFRSEICIENRLRVDPRARIHATLARPVRRSRGLRREGGVPAHWRSARGSDSLASTSPPCVLASD